MKDLISMIVTIFIFVACITLFIQLLPFLIILLIIFLVMRYFRENKQVDNQDVDETKNNYQTSGTIKQDVIDVEYKETVEK